MTNLDYVEYIQRQVSAQANKKFTNPRLATQYIVGLLTAQLAEAMMTDTRIASKFKHTMQLLNKQE